ncbi:MATE family efflux transporter [Pseudodonghicola flavimaris]|uniref:MATE family efflux transporter n=1 Tax=Pseudodonghicola flavimaris TaxID=3050036 RepID=A0ABT7F0Y8_9RHOB|nr:MATE family efflux transporter [Pseudodonghicola flavimaris]MDK3018170.1 MATE family efflux transporter [Pseudodonghicola flavimaris]
MSSQSASENRFLTAPPGRLFWSNVLPMMVVMTMSGLQTVIDAAFLGHFVGARALAAVSIVFPVLMVTIALSTLVGGGMSSLLARHLGAGDAPAAAAVFAGAHGLAVVLAAGGIALFWIGGETLTGGLAGGDAEIAGMARSYLAIMIYAMPVQLALAVHADAGRNEGRAGLMALMSLGVTLANIALTALLIVGLGLGVAGSAWGTALAQALGLGALLLLRWRHAGALPLAVLWRRSWGGTWAAMLRLGAPLSLSFLGIALVAATVIATLRLTAGAGYAEIVAAYGLVTRIFSFTFLPLMAIALATQSIVGNNIGARRFDRSDRVLRLALAVAFVYCLLVEAGLLAAGARVGTLFVPDAATAARVVTVLHPMVALYLFAGPVLVLALYFQAAGRPGRTALLTLVKPLALGPLLVVGFGTLWGAQAIWYAFPVADAAVIALAAGILWTGLRRRASGVGLGG